MSMTIPAAVEGFTKKLDGFGEILDPDVYKQKIKKTIADTVAWYLAELSRKRKSPIDRLLKPGLSLMKNIAEWLEVLNRNAQDEYQKVRQQAEKNYQEIKQWWEKEKTGFVDDLTEMVNTFQKRLNGQYKRIVLVPTNYKLEIQPARPQPKSLVVKTVNFLADPVVCDTVTKFVPGGTVYRWYNPECNATRIVFYPNLPPTRSPWREDDDIPDNEWKAQEKPEQFLMDIPLVDLKVPVTLCWGLETDIQNLFAGLTKDESEVRVKKVMPFGLQLAFSSKLYSKSDWVWLFLDPLEETHNEIKRYGFGCYLQGMFRESQTIKFDIEQRQFVDAVYTGFKAKDKHGHTIENRIIRYEPNFAVDAYLDIPDFGTITGFLRGNPGCIVGRGLQFNVTVLGGVGVYAGLGGEIEMGLRLTVQFKDHLPRQISRIGDHLIQLEITDTIDRLKAAWESAKKNADEAYRKRCPRRDCKGIGVPTGAKKSGKTTFKAIYTCSTCKQEFEGKDSDQLDQYISLFKSDADMAVVAWHICVVGAKTFWSICETIADQLQDSKNLSIVLEPVITGEFGLGAGGQVAGTKAKLSGTLGMEAQVFSISAPGDFFTSKDNWKEFLWLALNTYKWLFYRYYEQYLEEKGGRGVQKSLEGVLKILLRKIANPVEQVVDYVYAVGEAVKEIKDQKLKERIYKEVSLSFGAGFTGELKGTLLGGGSLTSDLLMASLEANYGAFCVGSQEFDKIQSQPKPNKYSFKVSNSVGVAGELGPVGFEVEMPFTAGQIAIESPRYFFLAEA